MQVKTQGRLAFDGPATAEAIEDLLFHDYYSRTPRLRLSGGDDDPAPAATGTEIILDHNDVASTIECALEHPSVNMRQAVLGPIWRHPETFRAIFRFGLEAPDAFPDIRKIVAEELALRRPGNIEPAPATERRPTLLPQVPLPAHVRRGRE
ncbi:MAG: hypothetical protein ACM3JG_09685 [Thiohalocapsa sp.]